MRSRGSLYALGAGSRKSLALFWTALLVCSMVLQYLAFSAPASVLAVHDIGVFELDGNAVDQAAAGDDWENGTPGAEDTLFIPGSVEKDGPDGTYFTGGGSKDENDITAWNYTTTDVAPDKDELIDVFASVYQHSGDTIVYFGSDKFDDSGDAQIGFWFFRRNVNLSGGNFTTNPAGGHANGDVLVLSDFTNGGNVDRICVYEWDGSSNGDSAIQNSAGCDLGDNLVLVASGADCQLSGDGAFDVCADVNDDDATAPWAFENKDGDDFFGPGQFYEGGINLSSLFDGEPPCFNSFLAETRSSQETDAQLKDFALGSLDTCVPPDLTTEASNHNADFGESITDTATLSGSHGPVEGTITFFLCGPSDSYPVCDGNKGDRVGDPVTIHNDEATSDPYEIGTGKGAAGKYCFRAEYTPSADSQYLRTAHTDQDKECFKVDPPTIDITKIASPEGPVNAGDEIGFDITVTNTGSTTARGIDVTDDLPAGISWTADAPTGSTATLSCAIASGALHCTKDSLGAGNSFTIHVHGLTDAADCGEVTNKAHVSTSNDGSDDSTAKVTVQCPDITVTKEPDAGDEGSSVSAGEAATFTIKVENVGDGDATDVELTDPLPDGIDWSDDSADCIIDPDTGTTGQVLDCSFGDLASGDEVLITLTGMTDKQDCGTLPNTASATASNEPSDKLGNNEDDGAIEVKCATIEITKEADAETVNATDQIGFAITVTNSGTGTAFDVAATDTLPADFDWSIESQDGGWTLLNGELTYTAASLAAGAHSSVHIVADTTRDDCGPVLNTATVTAASDGSDEASDTTTILCADIEIAKTADHGLVNAGDEIGFVVTVSNAGDGDAYGVVATDPLPAGFDWTIESGDGGWSIDSGVLAYEAATLAAGGSATVHIVASTDAEACATVPNTASVTTTNDGGDEASASVTIQCPDLEVTKDPDPGEPGSAISAGDVATFTMVVTNLGPGTAHDATLSDPLPDGVDWSDDSADCSIAPDSGTTGQVLTCDFGDLVDGATRTITLTGETNAAACGVLLNTATVAASNEPSDALGNNEDDGSITVDCADIVITKTADAPVVSAGEPIGFVITVTNNGLGEAKGVMVSDELPTDAGTAWGIDADPTQTDPGWSIDGGGVLHWGPATLASGASVQVHITSPTIPATCGEVDNQAFVTTTNDGSDDDRSRVTVECPDLRITKTADDSPILAGETASFTITIWNEGPGTAFDVVVTDDLPAGIDWTDDSERCAIDQGVLTCELDELAPDDPFSVTISGASDAEVCADIPNIASVAASNEPAEDTSDNTARDEIDVQCASIELVKTAGDAPDGGTLLLEEPGDVVFTYVVTNTGTAALESIELVDDNATPDDPSDDITVACPETTLGPGESMLCTATMPVGVGLRTNTAEVTANPEIAPEEEVGATDDAVVQVPEPEVTPSGSVEELTPPPTSTLDETGSAPAGNGLLLVLLFIAGIVLTLGYLSPAKARARRNRRR